MIIHHSQDESFTYHSKYEIGINILLVCIYIPDYNLEAWCVSGGHSIEFTENHYAEFFFGTPPPLPKEAHIMFI